MTDTTAWQVLMDRSWVYRTTEALLAPGAEKVLGNWIRRIVERLRFGGRILDVGCGPFSRLWTAGVHPVGLDISPRYAISFRKANEPVITGSADALPFTDKFFDGVWSFGLLHHLPDEVVDRTIKEIMRVCRGGGYIIIFDGVKPESSWRQPLASMIRSFDRGRYMRRERELEAILQRYGNWFFRRIRYSLTGLEGLFCMYPGNEAWRHMTGESGKKGF